MSSDANSICEQISRPYRKRHGMAVAGLLRGDNLELRIFKRNGIAQDGNAHAVTIFEIGSITKTFTAILMCELACRGNINLDEPVRTLLDGFDRLPDWITPRTLATHTSGLPRIPDGIEIKDMSNPYHAIGEAELRDWVAKQAEIQPKSEQMAYSNFGMGLLGLALGKAAGSDYATALRNYVTGPLGLADTDAIIPPDKSDRLAHPHGSYGRKVPVWDFDALAGCGALKSTAADMARYAGAVIDAANEESGPLSQAIRMSCEVQLPSVQLRAPEMCLGWIRLRERETGTPVFHHDGGTGGSSSTLFVCPQKRFAIFVLANTSTTFWTGIKQQRANPLGLLSKLVAEAA